MKKILYLEDMETKIYSEINWLHKGVERDDQTQIRIDYFKKEDVWKSEEFLE